MKQGTLFRLDPAEQDICKNRHGGSDTSVMADKRVRKENDRSIVYGYVVASKQYGITLDEACIILSRNPNEISGRFSELKRAGRIIMTAATRATRTGSWAHVYVVAS